MTAFDLVLRGGTVVDGTGGPGRRADVGVLGDRILAVGDLSAVDPGGAADVIDVGGRVVAPGFVDPHGHSDGSVLLDGALISHLRQGYTTQLSGNCGDTLAPITERGRELVELALRPHGLVARWRTFGEYLDAVEEQELGPNVAFLVGHGTVRGSVLGSESREPDDLERRAMVREVEAAMESGAFGLSSGLIYAPGMHARPDEMASLVVAATRRGGLYATHMRDETHGLFDSLAESVRTIRAAADAGVEAPRLQVSHLKCGLGRGLGSSWRGRRRAGGRPCGWPRCRRRSIPVHRGGDDPGDDRAAGTARPRRGCLRRGARRPRRSRDGPCRDRPGDLRLGERGIRSGLGRDRDLVRARVIRSGLVARSPRSASRLGADPMDVAFDALVDDRLDVSIVLHCMAEPDVETIMAVPWISVCTDADRAATRAPDPGRGSAAPAHVRQHRACPGHVRTGRGVLVTLETAVAKLTSVPAARLGLRDRGVLREGALADLVVFDPATVEDVATYAEPTRHPVGIDHVVVNGRLAVRDGVETGVAPGDSCGGTERVLEAPTGRRRHGR